MQPTTVFIVVFILSSAKASNTTSHICKNDKEQYDAIVNKIATYVSNKMINQCKGAAKGSEKGQNKEAVVECLKNAANMSVGDLPAEIKTKMMRLALFEVKFVMNSINDASREIIKEGKSLIKNAAEELNKLLRGAINSEIRKSGLVHVPDAEALRPRSGVEIHIDEINIEININFSIGEDIANAVYETAESQFEALTSWF
uniref:Uncharacterized protein n=1 Tax=Graphocephala atropunctata TaxID=36148 RepID=A0A1B6LRC3_9HEMI